MDPFTLLSVGSTALRWLGKLKGGKAEKVVNSVADVVDSVTGLSAEAKKRKVEEHLASLPPEELVELKSLEVEMAKVCRDREANQLNAQTAQYAEQKTTERVEAQSTDEYVRRRRPTIAQQSAYVTFVYVLFTEIVFRALDAFQGTNLSGADPWVIGMLFSPCLTYMGVRTADKIWQRNGGKDATRI